MGNVFLNLSAWALAGVALWIEHWPANQRVTSLIPSHGTCLGCRSGPQLEVCEGKAHTDVYLPLSFPSLPLEINKIFFKI